MARGTDGPSTRPGPDLREVGERIDVLLDSSGSHGPVARERAEELVRLVTDLYGAGLERLLELLHESGHLDDELLDRLARDDLVASLLLVHGLMTSSYSWRYALAPLGRLLAPHARFLTGATPAVWWGVVLARTVAVVSVV